MKNLLLIVALCITGSFVHGQEVPAAFSAQQARAKIKAEEECGGRGLTGSAYDQCVSATAHQIFTGEYAQY